MVKIWIIYHTKYGNCGEVGNELKNKLIDKFDVSIGDVKNIKLDSWISNNYWKSRQDNQEIY